MYIKKTYETPLASVFTDCSDALLCSSPAYGESEDFEEEYWNLLNTFALINRQG